MSGTLQGKVAFVNGGSRGIGAAIVRRLAAEGAAVAFTYASSPDKAEQLVQTVERDGGKAVAIQADASDPEALRAAVTQTAQSFGRIDVAVNNAGIATITPIEEVTVADFDRIVAINVRAALITAQETSKHMQPGGRIINIGSVAGDRASSFPGFTLYSMSKAALNALTRGLAHDLAPRGITVNNVQPGPVDTDMNPKDGEMAAAMLPKIPVGRYGETQEIASLVAYLAGPETSFITGAGMIIDGGATA